MKRIFVFFVLCFAFSLFNANIVSAIDCKEGNSCSLINKTATEIVSSKQRMYSTVKDIQGALESALNNLIYAMSVWAKLSGLSIDGYEVSIGMIVL